MTVQILYGLFSLGVFGPKETEHLKFLLCTHTHILFKSTGVNKVLSVGSIAIVAEQEENTWHVLSPLNVLHETVVTFGSHGSFLITGLPPHQGYTSFLYQLFLITWIFLTYC